MDLHRHRGAQPLRHALRAERARLARLTPNPTYEETCTGRTGHTEAVIVVYDPTKVGVDELVRHFWEQHDPTTLNRQGNDVGTQYRSAIYWTTEEQRDAIDASRRSYQHDLTGAGYGQITTEIASADEAGPFYFAEEYHQQYLAKNPNGYCNHGFCQIGYDLDENLNWAVTREELERKYEKANKEGLEVKALALINPGNPSGNVMTHCDIQTVAEFCAERGIVLLEASWPVYFLRCVSAKSRCPAVYRPSSPPS